METTPTTARPLTWKRLGAGLHIAGRYQVRKDHRPGVAFWRASHYATTLGTFTTCKAAKLAAEQHAAEAVR